MRFKVLKIEDIMCDKCYGSIFSGGCTCVIK
ncbi:hypothetical protein CPL00368_CDS0090 [Klebsiella phage DevonBitter]